MRRCGRATRARTSGNERTKTYLGQARLDGERAALGFRGHRVRRRALVTLFAIDVEGRGRGGDGRSGVVIEYCFWVRIRISCLSFTFIPPWRFIFYVMDADDVTVYVKRHPPGAAREGGGGGGEGRRRRRRRARESIIAIAHSLYYSKLRSRRTVETGTGRWTRARRQRRTGRRRLRRARRRRPARRRRV